MGQSDGEHEHEGNDLSADDSSWSDGVWSEDDNEESLSFEDSGEGSGSDGESDDAAAAEESDSSEDEVAPRNTVGDVPLEWYKDEEHIGYDIDGRKIRNVIGRGALKPTSGRQMMPRIESSRSVRGLGKGVSGKPYPRLCNARRPRLEPGTFWQRRRKIYDEYNDEEVQITKDEAKIISRLLKGKTPHTNVDPYPDYVDWFEYEDKGHPLSSAPEPKRRFVPSKWEQKKAVKLVRAIRNGWIKFDKPKEERNLYLLWGDETDTADNKRHGLSYIPPPKPKLPGHEESYNPSIEYIPSQEEIDSYQLMYEEDRLKFIPKRFESLRSVPAYEKALREGFDRCLDLYLCPRTRKKRINIDPESLKPKLPSKKDLRPYPKTCYLEFKGHTSPVKSISVEITGQWLASGSCDGTIRVWEVETGRCLKVWNVGGDVRHIAWNPSPDRPILAAVVGHDLLLINAEVGSEEMQMRVKDLLKIDEMAPQDDTDKKPAVRWMKHEKLDGITLIHQKAVSNVEWHYKGDYFTTVVPTGDTRAVLLHQLTKKHSHHPFRKLPGLPVAATFHPSQKMFFVATKKFVQVYDLQKAQLVKKLESGLREISSISIHPGGDNVIVGSKDGKLCWFDTDLSTRPYKTLKGFGLQVPS
ncbi:ribosome biogenesis protein BOP1 homolog isoform X2 [Miscanthus floridulus]|uniref:ribosome biogenesis protein BOP1 homolog isoform X2 n=1 Tax=Miscanthus floridulus TaxID=154761 RepID=UPI00345A64FC